MMKSTRVTGALLILLATFAGCGTAVAPIADVAADERPEKASKPSAPAAPAESRKDVAAAAVQPKGAKVEKSKDEPTQYNALTRFEEYVILQKGTERMFVGEYTDLDEPGTYICRRCNAPLYKSEQKFHSGCGWPAFDDQIAGAVDRHRDADGQRVEIVCHNCGGHLGHVFEGEGFTQKNVRHCVNSVSMKFIPRGEELPKTIRPKQK